MSDTVHGIVPNILSREKFLVLIDKIKKMHEFEEKVYTLFSDVGASFECYPTFEDELVRLLSAMFLDEDYWIPYFIYDLNFGELYTDGMVTKTLESGEKVNIDLSTADKLYDLVIENFTKEFQKHEDLDK